METYVFTAVDPGMVTVDVKDDENAVVVSKDADRVVIDVSDTSITPGYSGEYEIVPTMSDQVFPTRSRRMIGDLTVHAIPYTKTTNQAGGYTAIIGG